MTSFMKGKIPTGLFLREFMNVIMDIHEISVKISTDIYRYPSMIQTS